MKVVLRGTAAILAGMIAGCAVQPAEPVQHIQRVEKGDGSLTCSQITAQVAEMEALMAKYSADQQQAAAAKASKDSTMTTMAYIPVVGAFAGTQMNESTRLEGVRAQAAQDRADATARKDTLVTLGNAKGCFR